MCAVLAAAEEPDGFVTTAVRDDHNPRAEFTSQKAGKISQKKKSTAFRLLSFVSPMLSPVQLVFTENLPPYPGFSYSIVMSTTLVCFPPVRPLGLALMGIYLLRLLACFQEVLFNRRLRHG